MHTLVNFGALTPINNFIVQFQKKYILPPQKGLEFPGGGVGL